MLHTWARKSLLYVLYITVDRLNPSMFSTGKFAYISDLRPLKLELSEDS
jgi:hypothetical protein